jgi:hypothetical protein
MSENSPENLPTSPENAAEKYESAAERREKLDNDSEKAVEQLSPRDAEQAEKQARVEALESAISVEAGSAEKDRKPSTSTPRGPISKKQRTASYKRTMKQVQAELPASSRAFSKFIHSAPVEKASEIVGSTIARPNAILSGAVVAFVLTLAVYVTAKIIGYALSGFETIAAFIIGWVIGVIYDYLHAVITGKKS